MITFSPDEVVDNAPDLWRELLPSLSADTHKYSRGTALVRGGAEMTGASRLAARAAQRMGAGLVTIAAPANALPIYAAAFESVIVRPSDTLEQWKHLLGDARQPAVLIGPGLDVGTDTCNETIAMLAERRPCVLDAGSLTSFAGNSGELFLNTHARCVLTPHAGEFVKLFGSLGANDDRVMRARVAAKQSGCVVLLKGSETVIAAPGGQAVVNRNAPPWLATAGSGDVLAGMILGLIAQKMPVFWAAAAATWFHGRAAILHGAGLIAEDIVEMIPKTLSENHF